MTSVKFNSKSTVMGDVLVAGLQVTGADDEKIVEILTGNDKFVAMLDPEYLQELKASKFASNGAKAALDALLAECKVHGENVKATEADAAETTRKLTAQLADSKAQACKAIAESVSAISNLQSEIRTKLDAAGFTGYDYDGNQLVKRTVKGKVARKPGEPKTGGHRVTFHLNRNGETKDVAISGMVCYLRDLPGNPYNMRLDCNWAPVDKLLKAMAAEGWTEVIKA